MSRQSEFKMRFDPELGRYTRQHIYGEGIMDVFKSVGSKLRQSNLFWHFLKILKLCAMSSGSISCCSLTGEHVGKKAGDKIVQMLSKGTPSRKPPVKKVTFNKNVEAITQQEIDQMLNNLISGGSTRKRKII